MNSLRFLTIAAFSTFCLAACDKTSQEGANTDAANSPEVVDSSKAPTKSTTIEFAETKFDFGKINQGEMVSHIFKFKNTGSSPLVIMDAKASCGCTVPQWTEDPVAPGESGEIEVKYNGSGKDLIHKTVTVYANTEPKETELVIEANVRPIDVDNKGPFKKK